MRPGVVTQLHLTGIDHGPQRGGVDRPRTVGAVDEKHQPGAAVTAEVTEAGLIAAANRSFQPQQIVVGNANLPTITHCFGQLLDIIHSRNLQTVTLNDAFT